jgi:hypothetical protein
MLDRISAVEDLLGGFTRMETFSVALSIVAAICIGVIALPAFFTIVG